MDFNYRNVLILTAIGIAMMFLCVAVSHAEENTSISHVEVTEYDGGYGAPLNYTPYIYQGDTVFMNTTIDISGVVPPYPMLAYWNGYDMYNSNASYIINLPDNKKGYYKFYIDPAIFEMRLGKWYKYNGEYEPRGWNLAFVVSPLSYTNYTMRFQNGSIINISEVDPFAQEQHAVIKKPPLPIKHVADQLVARGDAFNLSENVTMNVWLFGRANQLMNYKSVNGSIDISKELLYGFEPGSYTLVKQTLHDNTTDFTVTFDKDKNQIKWFDPEQFAIHTIDLEGLSPQVTVEKFKQIMPNTKDNFNISKFEFQEPSLEIMSIEEKITPNETIDETGVVRYNTNTSFVEVMGYTNVAPGSALKFILDEKDQSPRTIKSHTTTVTAEGNYGGDMRWFTAYIPVDKYGLVAGVHTITGYTNLSDVPTSVDFHIYELPLDSYVPKKMIRYVGGNEFVPTPTPEIQTVTVVQTVPVIQQVEVKVTPSPEEVRKQQEDILSGWIAEAIRYIAGVVILICIVVYCNSVYRRKNEMEK